MQFIPVFLFAIISSYSLVLAAPVNQSKLGNALSFRLICSSFSFVSADADSLQAKQQKATEIAGRLLKQMAAEQSAAHHQQEVKVLNADEPAAKDESSEEQADTEFLAYPTIAEIREYLQSQRQPIIADLDDISDERYEPLVEFDDEPSAETEEDDEEIFPVPYQFFEHNWAEEDESTSSLSPSLK